MEALRWILLAAGIAFVVVIYALGRSRRRRNQSLVDELEAGLEDDLPEFTAQTLDDVDEGVGKVRVVSGSDLDSEEGYRNEGNRHSAPVSDESVTEENSSDTNEQQPEPSTVKAPSDFIVLYILPKRDPKNTNARENQVLLGSQINSSAQAMGLTFGEMNIFHYKTNGRSVFSLANMLEPGSFDADTIHDLKTTGLTAFMKIKADDSLDVALDNLTEMLQRSYQIAGLLDARLCNHKRQTLSEQDAENYRTQVREFVDSVKPENM
jgi:cell division protein ZipA